METGLKIGDAVNYPESCRGFKWVKIGEVVEINGEAGRVRVKWSKWVYETGGEKVDTKRTWIASHRLTKV
jgi:ribosomal protein L35AE/L33A